MTIMNTFTLEEALEAKRNNSLKQWVIDFLRGHGNNKKLANHIEEGENLWIELIEFPLNKLRREMGPEEDNLAFSESKETWNKRVGALAKDIKGGYEPCPLIATDFWKDVHLADGSHRHEALLLTGFDEYWTLFIIKNKENIDWVLTNLI